MEEDDQSSPEEGVPGSKGAHRRKPSTGFPVVSLAEAAAILRSASKYGFEQSIGEFASHMGHTTTNSGAFRQRLAAFRDWKLITGRGDYISMTEIARIIALAPDTATERDALRAAFTSCAVFHKLYDDSQKNTPLERRGLGSRAVHAFGVSPKTVNKFIDSFVDSAVIAGFAEVAADDEVVLLVPGNEPGIISTTPPDAPSPSSTYPVTTRSSPSSSTPVVHQSWPIEAGTIVFEIRSERPLPAGAYATVGEVVASLEHLSQTLAPSPADLDQDAAGKAE
jgi:hypothetical protein